MKRKIIKRNDTIHDAESCDIGVASLFDQDFLTGGAQHHWNFSMASRPSQNRLAQERAWKWRALAAPVVRRGPPGRLLNEAEGVTQERGVGNEELLYIADDCYI